MNYVASTDNEKKGTYSLFKKRCKVPLGYMKIRTPIRRESANEYNSLNKSLVVVRNINEYNSFNLVLPLSFRSSSF